MGLACIHNPEGLVSRQACFTLNGTCVHSQARRASFARSVIKNAIGKHDSKVRFKQVRLTSAIKRRGSQVRSTGATQKKAID